MTLDELRALKMRKLTRPNPRPSKNNPTIPFVQGDAIENEVAHVRRNDTGFDVTIKATGARFNCPTAESVLAKIGATSAPRSARGSRSATAMAQPAEETNPDA